MAWTPSRIGAYTFTLLALASLNACGSERREVRRVPSPDGRVDAVLVRINSGATTSIGWNLFVVPAGEKPPTREALFIAERIGESELSIQWMEPRELEIRLPDARIFHFRNFWSSPEVDAFKYVVRLRLVESPRPAPPRSP